MTHSWLFAAAILWAGPPSPQEAKGAVPLIDVSERPSLASVAATGLALFDEAAQQRLRWHGVHEPPDYLFAAFMVAVDVPLLRLRQGDATLILPCERAMLMFPPHEVERRTLKDWPAAKSSSRASAVFLACKEEVDTVRRVVPRFVAQLGEPTADMEAWLLHRMWNTTPHFRKVFVSGAPRVTVTIKAADTPDPSSVLYVLVDVEWKYSTSQK